MHKRVLIDLNFLCGTIGLKQMFKKKRRKEGTKEGRKERRKKGWREGRKKKGSKS